VRGHIAKKGSSYYVVVDGAPDVEGKRRRKWHRAGSTREEAEEKLAEIVGSVYRGSYVEPSRVTVGSFLVDEWLPAVRVSLKPSTAKLYETLLSAYVVPELGTVKLQQLTPARLNRFYGTLLASGRRAGAGGLSPTSVRGVHRVLHRALRDALRWDRVTKNAAELADPPRAERPELNAWGLEDLASFIAGAAGDEHGALWLLLATTGMRRGEVLGLKWADIQLDESRVSVRRTLSYVGTQPVLSEPKTSSSRRLVAIPAETVAALRAHRARQAEVRLAVGRGYRDKGFVFADVAGEPLRPATVSRVFGRLVARLGLPKLTVHGLRHSWATAALAQGVHPKVVSEVLGHSSISVTLDVYSHASPAMQETAVQTVADRLFRVAR